MKEPRIGDLVLHNYECTPTDASIAEATTERLDELVAELTAATSEHKGVREMIATLRRAAQRASEFLLVTDGVGVDDE